MTIVNKVAVAPLSVPLRFFCELALLSSLNGVLSLIYNSTES